MFAPIVSVQCAMSEVTSVWIILIFNPLKYGFNLKNIKGVMSPDNCS